MPQQAATHDVETRAGKYLVFRLAGEEFGLEILKVREIIGMMDVTPVPLMPAFVRGIINLRGRVIPVMDLRNRFGMSAPEAGAASCIVVAFIEDMEVGLIVDGVSEVMEIAPANIQETPSFGHALDVRFISGIGTAGDKVTILLDVDKVLTDEEVRSLATGAA